MPTSAFTKLLRVETKSNGEKSAVDFAAGDFEPGGKFNPISDGHTAEDSCFGRGKRFLNFSKTVVRADPNGKNDQSAR